MLQHGLHPVAGSGELLLAAAGQRLAALPQRHRLVEAQPADLQRPDDLGELVAGLLVTQSGTSGRRTLAQLDAQSCILHDGADRPVGDPHPQPRPRPDLGRDRSTAAGCPAS